jgi:hypothetical protein
VAIFPAVGLLAARLTKKAGLKFAHPSAPAPDRVTALKSDGAGEGSTTVVDSLAVDHKTSHLCWVRDSAFASDSDNASPPV